MDPITRRACVGPGGHAPAHTRREASESGPCNAAIDAQNPDTWPYPASRNFAAYAHKGDLWCSPSGPPHSIQTFVGPRCTDVSPRHKQRPRLDGATPARPTPAAGKAVWAG